MNVSSKPRLDADPNDRYRDHEPVRVGDSSSASGAHRLDTWILHDCKFADRHNFDTCGTEGVANPQLFIKGSGDVDEVDANDVKQNLVGSCHVLGPACALAQSAEGRKRIHDMIKEVKVGDETRYQVSFYVRNVKGNLEPKTIEVDGQFVKGHAGTADEANGKKEIWPLVLESAYGKLRGSMQKIGHGADPVDAFEAITGKKAEGKCVENGWFKYGVKAMKADIASGKPMTLDFCDTRKLDESSCKAYGLHTLHAYAVTGSFEQNGQTFVTLRNPWGDNHPKPIPIAMIERWGGAVTVGEKP